MSASATVNMFPFVEIALYAFCNDELYDHTKVKFVLKDTSGNQIANPDAQETNNNCLVQMDNQYIHMTLEYKARVEINSTVNLGEIIWQALHKPDNNYMNILDLTVSGVTLEAGYVYDIIVTAKIQVNRSASVTQQ